MSRYFSEAMNNHPEFQRLKQRIRDLENGMFVKELQRQLEQQDKDISFLTSEILKANSNKRKLEEDLDKEKQSKKRLIEQMKEFNSLSRFRRLSYHFKID